MDAVQWFPRDNKEWLIARDLWKCAVLKSNLSAATKVVAIVIADFYINRTLQCRHFNWAWASQETLARAAGLSRRTVATAMDELERTHLIVVDRGGGRNGDRGRTHRYTLRMDSLSDPPNNEDEQNLHNVSARQDVNNLHNPIETQEQRSCANDAINMGNVHPKEVNGFPTTPSNISLEDSLYRDHPKANASFGSSKRLTNEKNRIFAPIPPVAKEKTNQASSTDQSDLASFVGHGDVRAGWEILMRLPVDEVDKLARRFSRDKSTGPAISEQVNSLLAKEAGAVHPDERAERRI
jgi:hypothetical protein